MSSMQFEPADAATFLVFEAQTTGIISLAVDREPEAAVRTALAGKWNRGAEDSPALVMSPALAREWSVHLAEAADAAERDLGTYLSGGSPS